MFAYFVEIIFAFLLNKTEIAGIGLIFMNN
jgi:hypothetical protein